MVELSRAQLDQISTIIFERVGGAYPFAFNQFALMFYQGCRFCDATRFEILDSSPELSKYKPCKNQVLASTVSPQAAELFYNLYQLDYQNERKYSYSTLQRQFNTQSFEFGLTLDGKDADLHIFRYNRIRQLREGGLSAQDIADLYGFSSTGLVNTYLSTPIFAEHVPQ